MTNEFIWPIPLNSVLSSVLMAAKKGKYIWLSLDPTLKTLLIRCVFGIQVLTDEINISHCSGILDSNQVMHLLFSGQLLLSSKLPFIQDGNTLLSLCLHADLFLSLCTPFLLPPYRPLSSPPIFRPHFSLTMLPIRCRQGFE